MPSAQTPHTAATGGVATQRVRWCVPQIILDVANRVDWPRVRVPVADLAAGLRALAMHKKRRHLLPRIKDAPPVPSHPPVIRVAPDVPQEILNVFNEIDWTQVEPGVEIALANELTAFVFGNPFMTLPSRHWQ